MLPVSYEHDQLNTLAWTSSLSGKKTLFRYASGCHFCHWGPQYFAKQKNTVVTGKRVKAAHLWFDQTAETKAVSECVSLK